VLSFRQTGARNTSGVDAGPGRGEVGRSDTALARDPHGGELTTGDPAADGVARDRCLLRSLHHRQQPGRVATPVIVAHS